MKRYGLKQEELYLVNDCDGGLQVRPGMVLNIPRFTGPSKVMIATAKPMAKEVPEEGKPERQVKVAIDEKKSAMAKSPGKEEFEARLEAKPGRQVKVAKNEQKAAMVRFPGKEELEARVEAKPGRQQAKATKNEKLADNRGRKQEPRAQTVHVVREGESLTTISNKYGLTVASLKTFNNLTSDTVYPTMKLKLVSYSRKKKSVIKVHVVKKGETLSSISNRYNVEMGALKTANNLKNDKVHPNMRLKIVTGEG